MCESDEAGKMITRKIKLGGHMTKKQHAQKAKASKAAKQEKPAEATEFKPCPVVDDKTTKEPKSMKESISKFSEMPAKLDALKEDLIQYHKDNNKEAVIDRIHGFALFLWRLRHQIKVGTCLWDE